MLSNATDAQLGNQGFRGVKDELPTLHISMEAWKSRVDLIENIHIVLCRKRDAYLVYALLSFLALTQKWHSSRGSASMLFERMSKEGTFGAI